MPLKGSKEQKMRQCYDEFKAGQLHSGSSAGPRVTSRQQAIAICLNKSGQGRNQPPAKGTKR